MNRKAGNCAVIENHLTDTATPQLCPCPLKFAARSGTVPRRRRRTFLPCSTRCDAPRSGDRCQARRLWVEGPRWRRKCPSSSTSSPSGMSTCTWSRTCPLPTSAGSSSKSGPEHSSIVSAGRKGRWQSWAPVPTEARAAHLIPNHRPLRAAKQLVPVKAPLVVRVRVTELLTRIRIAAAPRASNTVRL